MDISKNKDAEEIVGLRNKGKPSISLFMPHELGYACPICDSSDEVNLDFSEYAGFLYCHKCNLDIPSCLCVKYYEPKMSDDVMTKKEIAVKSTRIYLSCISQAKNKVE